MMHSSLTAAGPPAPVPLYPRMRRTHSAVVPGALLRGSPNAQLSPQSGRTPISLPTSPLRLAPPARSSAAAPLAPLPASVAR